MSTSKSAAVVVFFLSVANLLHRFAYAVDSLPRLRSLQANECRINTTILAFNFDDDKQVSGATWVPPNPQGAVGASRLVAVANSMMEVRQKDGTLVFRSNFKDFFSNFNEAGEFGATFTHPKVIYDQYAGRFVLVVLQERNVPVVPTARIWLAVSTDQTPDSASDWNQFFINSIVPIDGTSTRADYPGLEVDEEAVYVTANMIKFSDDSLAGVRLWVVNKGAVIGFYGGQTATFYGTDPYFGDGVVATMMPAQVQGPGGVDGSVGTFFPSILTSEGTVDLQIYTIFNPLSASPTSSIQTVGLGAITQPGSFPLAPQMGTSAGIDVGDSRILDAVWQNNKLWVVFTINPTSGVNQGQPTAHWARLSTSGSTVTLEAQGDLGGEGIAPGSSTFYPSVAVNTKGVVAYGYGASSTSTYAGAYVSTNYSDFSYTLQSGLAPYFRVRDGKNSWGEYTGISVDPIDDSFWVFNQYAERVGSVDLEGFGRWGTVWGRLECTPAPRSNCGVLGFGLFCPLTRCGVLGRFLNLCKE